MGKEETWEQYRNGLSTTIHFKLFGNEWSADKQYIS